MRKLALTVAFALAAAGAAADEQLLMPEAAFKSSVKMVSPRAYEVTFAIASGYQLYADKFKVQEGDKDLPEAAMVLPEAQERHDKILKKDVRYYKDSVTIKVNAESIDGQGPLTVVAQGCQVSAGVCYPPFKVKLTENTSSSRSLLDFLASKFGARN